MTCAMRHPILNASVSSHLSGKDSRIPSSGGNNNRGGIPSGDINLPSGDNNRRGIPSGGINLPSGGNIQGIRGVDRGGIPSGGINRGRAPSGGNNHENPGDGEISDDGGTSGDDGGTSGDGVLSDNKCEELLFFSINFFKTDK
jgi:hypothetical protein